MAHLLLVLLAASPAKIAAPGLTGSEVSDEDLTRYGDKLNDALTKRGAVVMPADAIDAQLGKSRPDCPKETPACMNQLGHALSADGVVSGTVRSTGFDLQIDLHLLSRKGGITPWSGRAGSSTEALEAMQTAGDLFGDAMGLKHARALRSPYWWLPGVIGLGFGALGGVFALATHGDAGQLEGSNGMPSTLTLDQANSVYGQGKAFETASIGALALGGVGLIVSVIWFFATTSGSP